VGCKVSIWFLPKKNQEEHEYGKNKASLKVREPEFESYQINSFKSGVAIR